MRRHDQMLCEVMFKLHGEYLLALSETQLLALGSAYVLCNGDYTRRTYLENGKGCRLYFYFSPQLQRLIYNELDLNLLLDLNRFSLLFLGRDTNVRLYKLVDTLFVERDVIASLLLYSHCNRPASEAETPARGCLLNVHALPIYLTHTSIKT